ncbi:methyltransferase [Novosphingobium sp. KCTC 2891]|uniref:class I SAM-dependent methyltransferase n=1 Tax=Novosphingobium sp. KCTC 2891 TaxID=2989730 RepID=UPI002221F1CF|nr:methyltransferase [Novosphingobium sp. KCTC 2891]MCW1383088.1 methyltransferase [Novosphingobium sp. KCTC 2891]
MNRTIILAAAAVLAAGQPSLASAKPDDYAGALADKARSEASRKLDESRMPAAILDFAGFRKGDTIADWGAGGGYYSELIADVVGPKGRVYAVNMPAFHKPDAWAPLLKAHPNVLPMVVPAQAQLLAPASLDGIFAHLEYHDLYFVSEKYQHPALDVDAVLRNWFAAVRPGGRVVIVDHVGPAGDPRDIVEKFHRIDPERVRADLERAGFVFDGASDVLRRSEDPHDIGVFDPSVRGKTDRFALRFRRPG